MDTTVSASQLAPKNTRRLFFQWAVKWFYANERENTATTKNDIPSIICLLQAIGFKLQEFEKHEDLHNETPIVNDNVRITMECGTSKMVAILEMDGVNCECPNKNETKEGSFWSVTGAGPKGSTDNLNKIEETGSNLLPEVTKETTTVVRDVVQRLLKFINNKCDVNQNTDSNMNIPSTFLNATVTKNTNIKNYLVRSKTDLHEKSYYLNKFNTNITSSYINSTKNIENSKEPEIPVLKRQNTYEIDDKADSSMDEPRPSPPKTTSSPNFQQLCTSLGQLSVQSDEEHCGLADYVVKAHQILEKAVNVIIKKLPIDSSHSSINEDTHFVKPAAPPLMSSSFCISSPRSKGSSSMINRSVSSGSSQAGSTYSMPVKLGLRGPTAPANKKLHSPAKSRLRPAGLPQMRDRSSSFGGIQRPNLNSPRGLSATNPSSVVRRRSTNAVTTTTTTTVAQRSATLVPPKLPPAGKPSTAKPTVSANRSLLSASVKSNASPKPSTPGQSQLPMRRGSISMIKPPSSRLNAVGAAQISKIGTPVKK